MAKELSDKEAAQLFNNAYELQKRQPAELQAVMEKIQDKTTEQYQLLLAGKRQYEKDVFLGKDKASKQRENDPDR